MKLTFLQAIEVTIFSMIIVFSVLAFIALVMKLLPYTLELIDKLVDKTKKNSHNKEVKLDSVAENNINQDKELYNDNCREMEVVAAIMAALSVYKDVPSDKLVIKSIKRINNSAWRESAIKNSLR